LTAVASIRVLDESGAFVSFSTQPVPISILARPQATLSSQFAHTNISAGIINTVPMTVSLRNAGALCPRLVFEYTARISCFFNQTLAPTSFFPSGLCDEGQGVSTLRRTVERTCDFDLQPLTFGLSGSCQITIDVLLFSTALTVPFFVMAGDPTNMAMIGQLPSHISGGGIIWSNNASLMKCLELSFTDKCNNTRSTGGFSCTLSGFLSNTSQYALLGATSVEADTRGRCIWFNTRMSLAAPLLVALQVEWLQLQRHLQPLVNVSGLGEAAVVSMTTPSVANETKAGNVLPPVTFKLFDANGVSVVGGSTVIRVRIVRKVNAAGR
jgi:hypothetical protein